MKRVIMIFADDSIGLSHYGVLGMKWGVRNEETRRKYASGKQTESYFTKTKNDETLELRRNRGLKISRILQKASPSIKEEAEKTYNYDAYVNGKKVGDFQMYKKSPAEMNITWGSTKKRYRGKGYMQAMYSLGETVAKQYGATKMTAELVGNSPDIHTIANKMGFAKVGEITTQEALDLWGGLTLVEKRLS